MRRKGLSRCVRSLIEGLESRILFNNVAVGTGASSIIGLVDVGGVPVAGATVYIDFNHDHTLDTNDPNTVTDSNGDFGFTQIANTDASGNAITYLIEVVPASGYQQQAPGYVPVTLGANATANTQSVVVTESAAPGISGLLFNDANENGIYEPPADAPLSGDTVYIDANGNGQLDSGEEATTTDANGLFNMAVTPGTYEVRVVPRPGFHQDDPGYYLITVGNSDQVITNIGETNLGTVSGTVFLDANGNGFQDVGDAGVAGETVNVNLNGATVASATTDINGQYFINGLTAGKYQVTIASNNGYVQDGSGYVDVTLAQGQAVTENLAEGESTTVNGVVFDDKNGNGIQDAGEIGQANQTVYLDLTSNGAFDQAGALDANGQSLPSAEPSAVTDANGAFTITGLGPGTYTARLILPVGAVATSPANASFSYTFTLASGQTLTNQDFGFKTPDLTITVVHLPTTPIFGNVLENTVFRITNVGSLPAIGSATVSLYVSTISTFNINTATFLGSASGLPFNLKPGASKIYRIRFAYPPKLVSGLYYDTAQVTSTAHDNNTANDFTASIGPIQITQPLLDLSLSYASPPPAEVAPGQATILSVVLANNGNIASTGDLTIRAYCNTTSAIEPDDDLVQSFLIHNVSVKAGHSKILKLVLQNPTASLQGPTPTTTPRFVLLYVDSNDPLGELNTTNNLAVPLTPTLFI